VKLILPAVIVLVATVKIIGSLVLNSTTLDEIVAAAGLAFHQLVRAVRLVPVVVVIIAVAAVAVPTATVPVPVRVVEQKA